MQTVLVVDDEPIVRDVVVRYLERDGFRTLTASDGDVARALIEEREPSLASLDVMLPGTDGLSLCRWIRERSSLPVILLTACGAAVDRIVGLELGADAVDTGTGARHLRRLRAEVAVDPGAARLVHAGWGVGYRIGEGFSTPSSSRPVAASRGSTSPTC